MINENKIEDIAKHYAEENSMSIEDQMGDVYDGIEELFDAYKAGAKWAINEFLKDLWHDTIEEPKEKVPLLYYRKHKFLPFMVDKYSDVYDWNALVYNFDITKWLYIEDLFPKEGGENG